MTERIAGYLLDDDNNPYPVYDMIEFAEGMHNQSEAGRNIVARTVLNGGIKLSTVFLFLDHGWRFRENAEYKPILFESMIFGGKYDLEMHRYHTWAEALEGHKRAEAYLLDQIHEKIKSKG